MSELEYLARNAAARYQDLPAVGQGSVTLSYRHFAARVDAFAAQLADHGVGLGDVVAVMLRNRIELLVAIQAAWRIGATATPVNPAFTPDEAEFQIRDAGAALVVTNGTVALSPEIETIGVDQMPTSRRIGWAPAATAARDDLALLIYTSGSTGRPKGVMLTHRNLEFMVSSMVDFLELTPNDHCLVLLPLFHVNAICVSFLAPTLAGAQISIMERFTPASFFDDVARLRPTYFSAVPTIFSMLITSERADTADYSSLRFAACGAAPIPKELLLRAEGLLGVPIVEGYGLTEGTCVSASNPLVGQRKPGTVGPAVPGQRVAIMDGQAALLPAGAVGEIVIRGDNVMQGYLGQPLVTAATVVDGWLHTGDVGYLDEDGYLVLVDRIKDMIIRGGENIYPKEIENALATHTGVLESAVVGVPDDTYGEVPAAYVVLYPDAEDADDSALMEHLRSRLARFKMPAAIHIADALPRNAVGKVDKPELRLQHVR
ncbi:class I adenylate-forming enzyme family protein [Rhodococcus sp. LB1]|uniref:class I adenylate-forming enzyme family protein n=1 Tax=Rhodococcus sp. LB1 TaxID=1807499 RepID=UPI00077B0AA1|nr:AMP-binding protein [Rhodococcus sp. LB1]KXX58799.1 AMP-dependent synthetase [Rhodococcus sp. LB1]